MQFHEVFADDLRRFPDLNMQHYRKRWYHRFHSADQRVRLALELVDNPKNEVIRVVRSAISTHEQLHEATNCNSLASDLKDGVNKDPLLTSCSIAFRPR